MKNFRVHYRIHTGNSKIYPCRHPPCLRKFSHTTERKDHESVHTGDKLFKCPHCLKSFPRNGNLWKHKKRCGLEQEMAVRVYPMAFPDTRIYPMAAPDTRIKPMAALGTRVHPMTVLDKTIQPITALCTKNQPMAALGTRSQPNSAQNTRIQPMETLGTRSQPKETLGTRSQPVATLHSRIQACTIEQSTLAGGSVDQSLNNHIDIGKKQGELQMQVLLFSPLKYLPTVLKRPGIMPNGEKNNRNPKK